MFTPESPSPFVVVTVGGEQTCTSPVVKSTVDPYWGTTFDLLVDENSVIVVQVFDQKNFKEPSQGFLGVVNILVNSVININTISTNTLKFDLRPSNSQEFVRGTLMLSLTTDMSGGVNALWQTQPMASSPPLFPTGSTLNVAMNTNASPSAAANANANANAGAGASTSTSTSTSANANASVSLPTSTMMGTSVNHHPSNTVNLLQQQQQHHQSQQHYYNSQLIQQQQQQSTSNLTNTASNSFKNSQQQVAFDEHGPLPPGWNRQYDKQGRPFYVDHNSQTTSWQRPDNPISAVEMERRQSNSFDLQRRMFEQRIEVSSMAQNDLPGGWERRVAPNGQYYYIDHNTQLTTWNHPNQIQRYQVVQPSDVERIYQSTIARLGLLPAGWEMRIADDGRPYYLDHGAKTSTWDDPRVPSAAGEDAPKYKIDFQKKLREFRLHPNLRITEGETRLKISRSNMFNDAFSQIMPRRPQEMKCKFIIEFLNEPGLDYGGVSREFFFLLSHEIFSPIYGLFIYSSHTNYTLQINPHSGINPSHLQYFYFIGRVIGTAIYQRKYLDVYFVTAFYKMLLDIPVTLEDIESIDADVYKGLIWVQENDVNDAGITFSGEDEVFDTVQVYDLIEDGRNVDVNNENKAYYIDLIVQWRAVSRVQEQVAAIKHGLYEIIPHEILSVFNERELEFLFCGVSEIDVKDWKGNTLYRSFSPEDQVIVWFWHIVEDIFDKVKRAQLLQFVTGTSRIPLNGFKDLQGSDGPRKFTIEKVYDADMLPRSHTCFNRIDLPVYPSLEILLARLTMAIECSEGFDEK